VSKIALLLYYLVPLAAFAIAYLAQERVRRVFREEDQVPASAGITGMDTARELLSRAGLHNVRIELLASRLGDYYDPMTKVLRLSPETARRTSILAVGVAAHEAGHAIQDAERYGLMRAHNVLARWLVGLTFFSPIAFVGGFFLGSRPLLYVAIGILAFQLLFALVALPLEINASKRAVHLLEQWAVILPSEERNVKRVLRTAAFTYLASAAVRLAFLMFWFIVFATATGLWGL
jgi:Zn-dependent membrane protease YugP